MGNECFSPIEGEKTKPESLMKGWLIIIFISILNKF